MIPRPARTSWMAIGVLLLLALTADAQTAGRTYRLGILANAFEVSESALFEEFLEGLRKQGFTEGRNLVIEWRSSEGRFNRLPLLAAELVRAKVDVIVASSALPAHGDAPRGGRGSRGAAQAAPRMTGGAPTGQPRPGTRPRRSAAPARSGWPFPSPFARP